MPRSATARRLQEDPRLGPTRGRVSRDRSVRLRKRHANDKALHLGKPVARYDKVVNWYRRGSGR